MSDPSGDLSEKHEKSSLPPLSSMLMSSDVAIEQTAISEEKAGIGHWMAATGIRFLLLATFTLLHGMIFSYGFWISYAKSHATLAKSNFGIILSMANAAALVLYFDLAVLIFPVCQTLTSIIKRTPLSASIHYDTSIFLHKIVGWYLVFFASVHTIGHCVNFALLAAKNDKGFNGFFALNFGTILGWSGYVMFISLGLIAVTSLKRFRLANFERFYYTHHLFVLFFVISSVHGLCCMIEEDKGPDGDSTCRVRYGPIWQWWMYGGFGLLLAERIKREVVGRYKTYISKVIRHPCNVVEIQIKKDKTRMKIGQYIYLCCPEVSLWQHHPFLLTSAAEEEFLSVHIHCTSDFTSSIAASIGCDFEHREEAKDILTSKVVGLDQNTAILDVDPTIRRPLPRVFIDGPFGGAWEDVFDYEIAVLIGAGTGIMPFASILKSIWYRMNYPHQKSTLRKVYFFWVCRDIGSFEWFVSLLRAIEAQDMDSHIEIHMYLTGKAQPQAASDVVSDETYAKQRTVTGLRTPTIFGRPHWDAVFESIRNLHSAPEKVGVFFSGPPPMGRQLSVCCNKRSKDDFDFVWRKGNF